MQKLPAVLAVLTGILLGASVSAQPIGNHLQIDRKGQTIVLEPYAPNILRVTLSLKKEPALAAPGFGFVASPENSGWSASQTAQGDVYKSSRIVATVDKDVSFSGPLPSTIVDISKFFNGSTPGAHITLTTPEGAKLLELTGWSQAVPNHKDGTASLALDRRPSDSDFYTVGATFASPDDEHYYGLGQNQEGFLDHRGHTVRCWNDYLATGGPSTCVPFLLTNKGYGLVWDNASKTTIEPGFNEQTLWTSEVEDRVSFFVIAGATADEIYAGYKQLTGPTPLLPKAAYGYIQCKQRYSSQQELLDVAQGYRARSAAARCANNCCGRATA
jgi:alpha-D-xyloside xylohydrolase